MRTIKTSFGPIPVWGRFEAIENPLLFVIRGALPAQGQYLPLVDLLPDADVALVHLPGMHTPFFAKHDVEDFAKAFDEVLATLGHSRVVVLGSSIGGVVALAMRSPHVRRLVLLDAPLSTAGLWPLSATFADVARRSEAAAEWLNGVFGFDGDTALGRDYRPVLDRLTIPATVLLGSEPLEPVRPVERIPSLVGSSDRAAYGRHPMVKCVEVKGTAHHVAFDAPDVTLNCLRWALREAA